MNPDSSVGHDDTNAGLDDDPIAHRIGGVSHAIGNGRWSCRVHGRRTIRVAFDQVMVLGDMVRSLRQTGRYNQCISGDLMIMEQETI
jgi:hypothetical protein